MKGLARRDLLQTASAVLASLALTGAGRGAIASSGSDTSHHVGMGIKMSNKIWQDFCASLAEVGAVLDREKAPRSAFDQAEGVRYLTRLMRTALEMTLESSDPDFPRFFQLSNETIKIGADNPDNQYLNAVIAGDRVYRIRGKRGTVPYLSFGTNANRYAIDGTMAVTGDLEAGQMHIEADGSFEIHVGGERGDAKNWLPTAPDSTMLIVRQTFLDKAVETPASISIEAVGGPEVPAPLTEEKLTAALKGATAFMAGTANTFAQWTEMFMERPNELLPWDQSFFQRAGGDPNIYYLHGYWELKEDEAWVIRTQVPECQFWNFQLDNWWMESLDYRTRPNVWVNMKTAKLEADGSLLLVVAARDPGYGNWIDTAGHDKGTALLRWVGTSSHPHPTAEVVRI